MVTSADNTLAAERRLIGIFGGTFDPVHLGHLRMAQEVLDATPMDELRFVPCHIPPHRGNPGATSAQRAALLESAVAEGDRRFRLDRRELEREGPSYMVDTLHSLREELGEYTSIALILGQDAMSGLCSWSRWRELTTLAHLIVLSRPGYSPDLPKALAAFIQEGLSRDPQVLLRAPHGRIVPVMTSQLEISASHIRDLMQQNRSARYLVPDTVLAQIDALGLYHKV